jgi:hypothetical protein
MAQLPSQSSLICAVARGQLCLWVARPQRNRRRQSEPAQRGGGSLPLSSLDPGKTSATVRGGPRPR